MDTPLLVLHSECVLRGKILLSMWCFSVKFNVEDEDEDLEKFRMMRKANSAWIALRLESFKLI